MAYATYTTDAIVCGSKDSYTSDRAFLLFTRDGGMLWATARSVREEKSKQRYALQDFSFIRVSLVKGKTGWRIGSVEAMSNPFMEARARSARAGVSAVVKLLRRFLHGEDPHPEMYQDLSYALACIAVADTEDVINLQNQFTLRLLYKLGYIAPHESYSDVLDAVDPWSVPAALPGEAHQAIDQALKASHL